MNIELLIQEFIKWSQKFVTDWGYPGLFLVNFIAAASVVLPVPSFILVFIFGGILNPWLVALVASAGNALGELSGYVIGVGGKKVIERNHRKWLERTKAWIEKHGIFPIIILFGATPLPDDITGILGGVIKYDWKKFLLAVFIGKMILNLALAWAGFYGTSWVLHYLGG
jgi:membrane protein YqaA with SNARE-associated domain